MAAFLANPILPFLDRVGPIWRYFTLSVTEPEETAVDVASWLRPGRNATRSLRENEVGARICAISLPRI